MPETYTLFGRVCVRCFTRPGSPARGFVYEGEVWLSLGHLAYSKAQQC